VCVIELHQESVLACPLCSDRDSVENDRVTDTLMPEINRYLPAGQPRLPTDLQNVRRRCTSCGVLYLAPRLDGSSLATIYHLWYRYAYRRVMADPSHIAERLREFTRNHLRLLQRYQQRRGSLLDVGCGNGLFLQVVREHGWQGTGIELDPDSAAWGREHSGIADIRCGTLNTTLRPDDRFNAITIFDYLEHTATPGADIDRLIEHLVPGGLLLVRVPNAAGWQARWMREHWPAVMATHLTYFAPHVLHAALASRGLEILTTHAGNYHGELEILIQRWQWLWRRLGILRPPLANSHDVSLPQPELGDPISAMRRWLYSLWIEQVDHMGGWLGQGNNLTLVARKAAA